MFSPWVALLVAGSLELDPALPCGLATDLQLTLPPGHVLRATRDGDAIDLRLMDGAVLLAARRLTPKPEDCPALPRIVATLVRSWLNNPFPVPAPVPAKRKPTPTAEAVVEPEPPAATAPEPEPEPEPEPLPAPQLVAPRRAEVRDTPPATFAVMAAGGAAFGPADALTGSVSLTGDWTISGRFGLGLDGGLQSDRTHPSGKITVQLHWLGVAARAEFLSLGAHHVFFGLGVQLVHLGAAAAGVGADLFLPAMTAHLESRHEVTRSFFLLARAGVQGRLRPEELIFAEQSLTVPPWGVSLQVGLGWNFP